MIVGVNYCRFLYILLFLLVKVNVKAQVGITEPESPSADYTEAPRPLELLEPPTEQQVQISQEIDNDKDNKVDKDKVTSVDSKSDADPDPELETSTQPEAEVVAPVAEPKDTTSDSQSEDIVKVVTEKFEPLTVAPASPQSPESGLPPISPQSSSEQPNCTGIEAESNSEGDTLQPTSKISDTISDELEHTLTGTDNDSSASIPGSPASADLDSQTTGTDNENTSISSEEPTNPPPPPKSITVFELLSNCTWFETFEIILTGEIWNLAHTKGVVLTFSLLSDFQWKVFKILVLICIVNVILIGFSWKVYGTQIVEKFMQPTSSAILLEELKHSIAELKLPKEHSPRI